MSERRADEDLNVPSFLQEGPDASLPEARPKRTGAQIIGGCLTGAREEAGLSVEAVCAATRIRPEVIRQIEAGIYTKCGGEIYARGHIRTMAHLIGLDGDALIREYLGAPPIALPKDKALIVPVRGKAQVRIIRPATPAQRVEKKSAKAQPAEQSVRSLPVAPAVRQTNPRDAKKITKGFSSQKGANWTTAMAAVLIGLVVVGGVEILGSHDKNADAAVAKPAAPVVAAPPAAPKKPAPVVVPTTVAFKVAAEGAPSWLSVYDSNGDKLYDNMLDAGAVQSFSDGHQLAVTVGNASAVHLELNGKDLGTAGGDGQVVHLTVNPTSVASS